MVRCELVSMLKASLSHVIAVKMNGALRSNNDYNLDDQIVRLVKAESDSDSTEDPTL